MKVDSGQICKNQHCSNTCESTSLAQTMAVNPLESLMSIALNHQSVCSTAAHPFIGSNPVSLDGHRRSIRSSQEPIKWFRAARNQHSPQNAARERSRVRNLRQAFHSLQAALPSVPPDTKLSKLDVLVLATNYIAYLTETLNKEGMLAEHTPPSRPGGYLHPIKKWPMRSLLYCGSMGELLSGVSANRGPPSGEDRETHLLTQPLEGDEE